MKIVLNKDETIADARFILAEMITSADTRDDRVVYQTNLTQDDIEYLIDKYVR